MCGQTESPRMQMYEMMVIKIFAERGFFFSDTTKSLTIPPKKKKEEEV